MARIFEIAGSHKRTEAGNNDWYYGGGGVAWAGKAEACAGVPEAVRAGKTVGVIIAGVVKEYIWHPGNTTDGGLVQKFISAEENTTSEFLTITELNTQHPDLIPGSEVLCHNISMIYKKGFGSIWNSIPMGEVPL